MSFDISRTPTLEAVATQDEQLLAQDLQKRVEEAIGSAESHEEIVAAAEGHRIAEDRLAKLRKAERALSQFSKTSREQAAATTQIVLDGVIESAISGDKPDLKKVAGLIVMESQTHFAMRAIERLVEHLIPWRKSTVCARNRTR